MLQRRFPLPPRRRAHREGKRDTEHFHFFWTVTTERFHEIIPYGVKRRDFPRALFVCIRQERDCFAKACPTSAIRPTDPAAATLPSLLPLVAFVHFQHHQCSIDGRKSLSIRSLSAACKLAFLPYAARKAANDPRAWTLARAIESLEDSHAKESLCS